MVFIILAGIPQNMTSPNIILYHCPCRKYSTFTKVAWTYNLNITS